MKKNSKKIKRIISMILCVALIASVIHIENLKNIFNEEIPAIENETEENIESTIIENPPHENPINQAYTTEEILSLQEDYDESADEMEDENEILEMSDENEEIVEVPKLYASAMQRAASPRASLVDVSDNYKSNKIINKGNEWTDIFKGVGKYQFNVTGASNVAEYIAIDSSGKVKLEDCKRAYIHSDNKLVSKGLEKEQKDNGVTDNRKILGGNSSGAELKEINKGTSIHKAYLVIEYVDDWAWSTPTKQNGVFVYDYYNYKFPITFAAKDKNGNINYMETKMTNQCNDSSGRCMSYIDVTRFVQEYGYTNYYCINIPFSQEGLNFDTTLSGDKVYHNYDHFASWKLIVIEKNNSLEYPRYLKMQIGADSIDSAGSSEFSSIDSLKLEGFQTPSNTDLISGNILYSMAGADGDGNRLTYRSGDSKDIASTPFTNIYPDEINSNTEERFRTNDVPLVDRITIYNKFKAPLGHSDDKNINYDISGADLDIIKISGENEDDTIKVGKNQNQIDFKFSILQNYQLGLLLDVTAIAVDIEVKYENKIDHIIWNEKENYYTVKGHSTCKYDDVSGYYNTETEITIPDGLSVEASNVTIVSAKDKSGKNLDTNVTVDTKSSSVKINWGKYHESTRKPYVTFAENCLEWQIIYKPTANDNGYSLRKSTFKSWINADGIVSNSLAYKNEFTECNLDKDSATVETLVVNPSPGKWNSTTDASYYTWCVQNSTPNSTDDGNTKKVDNPTPPTGYVFEKWVATSNGDKTGQWNSTTKKFKYKYEYSGESKKAIDYILTAKYRRSKSSLQVNLQSYTSVGTGYQPVLASDWTASHHKWSVADTGGTSEDDLLHDTDGSTSHTLSKSSNHTSFEQVCTGYYNDWDNIPDPVPENYKLTLTYNGGWDDVDDATYQNPIRSYALGVSTDMTFDTAQGTGGWTKLLGTDANFDNRVFTHGKTDNVTSYLTANWKGDYILTLPIVERWGYNFLGWYEQNADGTETLIDSTNTGIDIIMEKNRTFYAKWELITKDETINVKWLDNTNNYTTRPDSIYVELYRISGDDDGELCSKYITETLSTSSASWITRFSNETGFADASRGTKTSTIFDPNVYLTYTNASTNTKNSENNIFATDDGDYLIKISGNNSNPATSNTWTVTLKNLQKYDVTKENTEYVYVVKEVDCKSLDDTTQYYTSPKDSTNNYSTAMSSYYNMDSYNEGPSGEQNLTAYDSIEPKDFSKTIVNRLGNSVMGVKPWKSVVVQIHYNDADDKYHFRPYSLKVQLYQNYANYKNTAKDNYLDDSGVRILYKTANAQMIKANAFSSTGNSAGFDAAAGLNWYFVRFNNVPTVEDSTGIKIAYDAILTYGQSRYRYTIDDTDEYNNLGQTIKNYGSSHYYSIKHQTGIQSIIDLDYTYITNGTNILTVGDTTTSTTIAKKDVLSKLEEGYYFIPDNMNDIFQSSNRYDSGLLTNDYDDTTFTIDTVNQLIKYNDGKVGYAYPFSAFYKSMAYNLRYYYITESNEMTAVANYALRPIVVPDDKKTEYIFYTETLRWTFNVDLAGSEQTTLPEEYTGSNSSDDRTGNYNGSIDDDYTHTNNKLTITSNVKNQSGVHIDAEDTAYKNLQIDQEQEAFLITLKQVNKNWTGSSDSIGESYTNNSYPANGYIYYNYDTSRNRLTRIFQPEATPINDERYTPVGNEYNVIVPANGSTTIEYLPDGKYEVTCHYDIDFSNFTYETTSGKTASIEKESDGKYYLTFSSATVPDEQAITQSETIDYWRGYVDDMNNFEWNRRLRNNNFDLVSGTPSNVKDKTLYPFGNNDEKNTISYETSTIKNVPNSYSVYEYNGDTKKYANKCPIHGTFLVNGKCTDESCSYSTYQYYSNGSNIVDDKLPYNVYLQYKGTETNTLK